MADCAPPFVRRTFRVSFPVSLLFVFVLRAAVAAPAAAHAPVVVTGLVTDPSGGLLPGATVEALHGLRVPAVANTGVDGRYRVELPAEHAERVSLTQGIPCETIAH